MASDQVTIDLTYGKNALFVRQTVAVALGIAINRELTWEMSGKRCPTRAIGPCPPESW